MNLEKLIETCKNRDIDEKYLEDELGIKDDISKGRIFDILAVFKLRVEEKEDLAVEYWKKASDKGIDNAMFALGCYYRENDDIESMKIYLSMAITRDNEDAMCEFADFYHEIGEKELSNYYNLMAVQKGNAKAMYNVGMYYVSKGDIDNMINYLSMAAEKGDEDAMYYLTLYYASIEDEDNMIKCLSMSSEKGYATASIYLRDFYRDKDSQLSNKYHQDIFKKLEESKNSACE